MIIFFYGPDGYRLRQAKNEIVNKYTAKYQSGMNLFYLDFYDNTDTTDLENAFRAVSFFNEHKLIVCKNIFQRKTTTAKLLELLKETDVAESKDITLFVVENSTEKDMSLKNQGLIEILMARDNLIKNFKLLDASELSSWIRIQFKEQNSLIGAGALKALLNVVGNDTWALSNEIAKLTAYKIMEEITLNDVSNLVSSKIDLNIFDLVDAIGSKNKLKSTELLYKELKSGRDPYYLLTMITYQFRNFIIIKDLYTRGLSSQDISKKSGIHPFVVKKIINNIDKFNLSDIIKIYDNLVATDAYFKNGQQALEDSLFNFVLFQTT